MNISTQAYGTGVAFVSIYNELNQLESRYSEYLQQESITQEVQCLKRSLLECLRGSPEAASYLREHGGDILQNVKERLEAATTEQARIIEESPAEVPLTEEKADEASKATALAVDAKAQLEVLIDGEPETGEEF